MTPTHELPALPRDEDGPVFRAPWEATAFALAVRLSEAGYFTWKEWAAALAREIAAAKGQDESDPAGAYYRHWLAALERLCSKKGLANPADLAGRKEEWRQAYLHTPHGQPVELSAGRRDHGPDQSRSARP
jgi:nitrile hydratase accessory protein